MKRSLARLSMIAPCFHPSDGSRGCAVLALNNILVALVGWGIRSLFPQQYNEDTVAMFMVLKYIYMNAIFPGFSKFLSHSPPP